MLVFQELAELLFNIIYFIKCIEKTKQIQVTKLLIIEGA